MIGENIWLTRKTFAKKVGQQNDYKIIRRKKRKNNKNNNNCCPCTAAIPLE